MIHRNANILIAISQKQLESLHKLIAKNNLNPICDEFYNQ